MGILGYGMEIRQVGKYAGGGASGPPFDQGSVTFECVGYNSLVTASIAGNAFDSPATIECVYQDLVEAVPAGNAFSAPATFEPESYPNPVQAERAGTVGPGTLEPEAYNDPVEAL